MTTALEYKYEKAGTERIVIQFDPPVTKATLGIPFSFLILQQDTTDITATRFGRVRRIECETGNWVSYLKTRGTPEERLEAFKSSVGYVEPEPPPPEKKPAPKKPVAKAAETKPAAEAKPAPQEPAKETPSESPKEEPKEAPSE